MKVQKGSVWVDLRYDHLLVVQIAVEDNDNTVLGPRIMLYKESLIPYSLDFKGYTSTTKDLKQIWPSEENTLAMALAKGEVNEVGS